MVVRRGKNGGVSSKNKDWRSYYGAEQYDSFVEAARNEWDMRDQERARKKAEEKAFQAAIPLKPLATYGDMVFDHYMIDRMSPEQYERFIKSLADEEKKTFYGERDFLDDMAWENQCIAEQEAEFGDFDNYEDYDC